MAQAKVALITGASSGIGEATARLLAGRGYRVFGTSRKPDQHRAENFTLLPMDVRSAESVTRCVEMVETQVGRLDLLVCNAGIVQTGAIEENSIEDAQAQLDTNFFGAMRVIKAALPMMRRQNSGRIIIVSSVVGIAALPYVGLYSASKFALEGFGEALRFEMSPFNIHVSLLEPGFIKTNLTGLQPAHPLDVYQTARLGAQKFLQDSINSAPDPITVANAIVRLAGTARPQLHNVLGGGVGLATMKRMLPQGVYELLMNQFFHIPAPQHSN